LKVKALGPHADVLSDLIGTLQKRLAFAYREHLARLDKRKQPMKSPDPAECEWVGSPAPLGLQLSQIRRWLKAIPIVGDIDQITASRAVNEHLVYAVCGPARHGNAPLEGGVRSAAGRATARGRVR